MNIKQQPLQWTAFGVILVSLWAAWLPAHAILINFDSGSGYSTTGGSGGGNYGELAGQPSGPGVTTWTAGATGGFNDTIRVANDTIDGSGQMIQTAAVSGSQAYSFLGSSADLGGAFNSASSQLSFSLKVGFEAPITSVPNQTSLLRISFGQSGGTVLLLEVLSDGLIDFADNTTLHYATTSGASSTSNGVSSGDFVASPNAWITLSGTVNYATQTYTLSINGVSQIGSSSNIAFNSAHSAVPGNLTPSFNLQALNGAGSNYVPVALDNLSLQLVPEPGTMAYLGGGALLLFLTLRNARRRLS